MKNRTWKQIQLEALRKIKTREMTLAKVAKELGLNSRQAVNHYLRHAKNPSLAQAEKLMAWVDKPDVSGGRD